MLSGDMAACICRTAAQSSSRAARISIVVPSVSNAWTPALYVGRQPPVSTVIRRPAGGEADAHLKNAVPVGRLDVILVRDVRQYPVALMHRDALVRIDARQFRSDDITAPGLEVLDPDHRANAKPARHRRFRPLR